MATYSVYDNILIKLENVFLRVEMEVDKEITSLLAQHSQLNQQLTDLKCKIEVLNSLKRSFELYSDKPQELQHLKELLLKTLCNKQILLRFLQEKELLLNSFIICRSEMKIPDVILLNREYKQRKQLQEIELLTSFLEDDPRFSNFRSEVARAHEIFDLAVESGANDKLEDAIVFFQHFFEKVLNIYNLDKTFVDDFKELRTLILLQATTIPMLTTQEVGSLADLQQTYQIVKEDRIKLEREVDRLLYQFLMFQNGKKIVMLEIKNASGELESVLFREYAVKQKIQELKQYKAELNAKKDCFMKDPTVDGYTEVVQQLESVENRFRRLMMHKQEDRQSLASRFFAANKTKMDTQLNSYEKTPYHKILFQLLHNSNIAAEDKALVLRLSKPSKLINTSSGKVFFQRTGKTRSLKMLEKTIKKVQALH